MKLSLFFFLFFFFLMNNRKMIQQSNSIYSCFFFPAQRLQAFSHSLHIASTSCFPNNSKWDNCKTCFSCFSFSSKWWRCDESTWPNTRITRVYHLTVVAVRQLCNEWQLKWFFIWFCPFCLKKALKKKREEIYYSRVLCEEKNSMANAVPALYLWVID